MTVEIELVPDGQATIPQKLLDDSFQSHYLSDVSVPNNAPIESWRDIEREIVGRGEKMTLRVRGIMLNDVPDTLLTGFHEALTNQVKGVEPSYKGWVEYDESEGNLPTNR